MIAKHPRDPVQGGKTHTFTFPPFPSENFLGWKTKIHGQHAELAVLLRNDER
jgi:hypothetical protein